MRSDGARTSTPTPIAGGPGAGLDDGLWADALAEAIDSNDTKKRRFRGAPEVDRVSAAESVGERAWEASRENPQLRAGATMSRLTTAKDLRDELAELRGRRPKRKDAHQPCCGGKMSMGHNRNSFSPMHERARAPGGPCRP